MATSPEISRKTAFMPATAQANPAGESRKKASAAASSGIRAGSRA
jgi:hypothetical protein